MVMVVTYYDNTNILVVCHQNSVTNLKKKREKERKELAARRMGGGVRGAWAVACMCACRMTSGCEQAHVGVPHRA